MSVEKENEKVIEILNELLEREYSGVVRYSHYSLMVFGYNRIPIVGWFREQAKESLTHAERIGEMITTLGGHPSLKISKLLETQKHSIGEILTESLAHEREQLEGLHKLLKAVEGKSVWLEEFARLMIVDEESHCSEVEKMIKQPPKEGAK
jgi:bacterioferritin